MTVSSGASPYRIFGLPPAARSEPGENFQNDTPSGETPVPPVVLFAIYFKKYVRTDRLFLNGHGSVKKDFLRFLSPSADSIIGKEAHQKKRSTVDKSFKVTYSNGYSYDASTAMALVLLDDSPPPSPPPLATALSPTASSAM